MATRQKQSAPADLPLGRLRSGDTKVHEPDGVDHFTKSETHHMGDLAYKTEGGRERFEQTRARDTLAQRRLSAGPDTQTEYGDD
jgi:hypothetical protein